MDEKIAQQKYYELQALNQQIGQLQEGLQNIDLQLLELNSMIASLDDIANAKSDNPILVPVHNGIFARAKIDSFDHFLVNVGSNIIIESDLANTKKLLSKQSKKLEEFKEQTIKELREHIEKTEAIEREVLKNV
ncbi:prefoldin subunit alpha [Candidatus Woesearchaeota archaeon]|nr:prefoldin subunit alpha [Candidatus Woesearchaeota archaeon]